MYGARAFVSQIELFLYNNCHTDDAIGRAIGGSQGAAARRGCCSPSAIRWIEVPVGSDDRRRARARRA